MYEKSKNNCNFADITEKNSILVMIQKLDGLDTSQDKNIFQSVVNVTCYAGWF